MAIFLPSLCDRTLKVPLPNLKNASGKCWIVISENLAYKILLQATLPGSLKCRGGKGTSLTHGLLMNRVKQSESRVPFPLKNYCFTVDMFFFVLIIFYLFSDCLFL